jgi:hypothetical protein
VIDRKILRALKVAGNTHTVDDVDEAINRGVMQLWTNPDHSAVVVTELVHFPQYNVIRIALAAGELDAVMALQPTIEQFGRENGATKMNMAGREGWAAVLPKYGWTQDRRVMFEKDI